MAKIGVLIVEDHAVVREGLKILIQTDGDLEIRGEAGDGKEAVKLAQKLAPDVVLMDVAMPRCNGLEAKRIISRDCPRSRVLVLSAYKDQEFVEKALQAGAAGYLTKHSAAEDLLRAIRNVSRGCSFLSPSVAHGLRRRNETAFMRGGRHGEALTPRETQVLRLVARGLANKQIATKLGLSIKTVEKHRQALMDKLDIHERATLTRYALEKGVLEAGPD